MKRKRVTIFIGRARIARQVVENSLDSFRPPKSLRDNPICFILQEEVTRRIAFDNWLPQPVQWRFRFAAGEALDAYWGKRGGRPYSFRGSRRLLMAILWTDWKKASSGLIP